MDATASLQRTKRTIALALVVYFIVGSATHLAGYRMKEFPPFFNWFLFNQVPSHSQVMYAIRINEYDGIQYNPPVLFAEAVGMVSDPRSNRARDLTMRLGRALESNDSEALGLRDVVERSYLRADTAYEIVKITYDPVVFFKIGEATAIDVLAAFRTP